MALRLGEALVRERLITDQQLAKALERQVIYGGRLGTNFIELGYLTEESLVKFLGRVFGVPYADPKAFEGIKREVVETITPEMAERYMVIPIDREPKRLHLAMVNPTDLRVIDEVRFITGYEIVPYIASELRLLYALERYFGIQRPIRFISVLSGERGVIPEEVPVPARGEGPALREAGKAQPAPEAVGALERISQRLVEAKDREEIASIILDFAAADLKRVALFVVKSNAIIGWKAVGGQLADEMMAQIQLPLHQPSIFHGALLPVPQNIHLLEMMGGEIPQEAIAFPLTIKGKVVCLLYGDNGEKSLLLADFEDLRKAMIKASMALEMLILKKKILEM